MKLIGKLLGATIGLSYGGPIGAFIGAALGHAVDSNTGSISLLNVSVARQTFLSSLFGVMGHLCKADGTVTQREIRIAERVMAQLQLTKKQRNLAIRAFNDGKKPDYNANHALDELQKISRLQSGLKNQFVEVLVDTALANGRVAQQTLVVLDQVCRRIGVNQWQLERIMLRRQEASATRQMAGSDPYAVLDIRRDASDAEVKRAYRRLISRFHPDKHQGDESEVSIEAAEQQTHDIRVAYEKIKHIRGMK